MENANKALLMAGGVLLGVLIISLAVYVFLTFSNFGESYDNRQSTVELSMYNNKFERYDRDDLTIHDIISVANLALEYKKNYDVEVSVSLRTNWNYPRNNNLYEKIVINFNLSEIEIGNTQIENDRMQANENRRVTYSCTGIEYGTNGGISSIKFEKNT